MAAADVTSLKQNEATSLLAVNNNHSMPPSKVIHCRAVAEGCRETDLAKVMKVFGNVKALKLMPKIFQGLVEFEELESAIACVTYSNIQPILVHGRQMYVNYSKSGEISREFNTTPGQSPTNILLLTIINVMHPVNVDTIKKICNQQKTHVQRIVIFHKNGLQALVEFKSIEDATRVHKALNGCDIYPGCCTLKIEFSKTVKLNVRSNTAESFDIDIRLDPFDQSYNQRYADFQNGAMSPEIPSLLAGSESLPGVHNIISRVMGGGSMNGTLANVPPGVKGLLPTNAMDLNNRNTLPQGGQHNYMEQSLPNYLDQNNHPPLFQGGHNNYMGQCRPNYLDQNNRPPLFQGGQNNYMEQWRPNYLDQNNRPPLFQGGPNNYMEQSMPNYLDQNNHPPFFQGGQNNYMEQRRPNYLDQNNRPPLFPGRRNNYMEQGGPNYSDQNNCTPLFQEGHQDYMEQSQHNYLDQYTSPFSAVSNKNSSAGGEGCVAMVYGINNKVINCSHLYNLFCLYGNVVKVKILVNRTGSALVQYADRLSTEMAIQYLNDLTLFGQNLRITFSKNPVIVETIQTATVFDGSPSLVSYHESVNNRFKSVPGGRNDLFSRINPPSKVLHYFNAPPNCTERRLEQLFECVNAEIPLKQAAISKPGGKSSTGLLEFSSISAAVQALILVNHVTLHRNINSETVPMTEKGAPYTLKLTFSTSKQINK